MAVIALLTTPLLSQHFGAFLACIGSFVFYLYLSSIATNKRQRSFAVNDCIYEDNSGLELKKKSKSPFGDHRRKNGRQMQKCSRQIVQEQKLKLEPHLIRARLHGECQPG